MRLKNLPPLLFLMLFAGKASFAQNTPEGITKSFFDLYKKGTIDEAIDYIFGTNKYAENNREGIDDLKRKLKKTISIEGEYNGYDLLYKKTAGDNLVVLTLLVRHERDPLTFRLLFYKPADKWMLQNFKYNNKMDEELEEASKVHKK